MKKIVFGITSLQLGGAERVLVDIANELSKNDEYQITIFTIYGQGELEKQVSQKVTIKTMYNIPYNQLKKIKQKLFIPLLILIGKNKIYKKYIKNKFDIEVAFLEGPITRIFSCGKEKQKKIAWVHNDISKVFGNDIKAKLKRKIDENLYNKFSKIIFVSKSNLESFTKTYSQNQSEKKVIYNYISSEEVLKKSEEKVNTNFSESRINLLTVARLVPQKALDRLIKIHAKLIKENINHNMYIIGEGPEKEKLEQLIKDNQCEETIKLLGKKENPYPYMKSADYICLLSNYEGYPMTLVEAKILNKNILVTDTAARETVENYNKAEILENSEEGIYEGLKSILTKENKEETINSQEQYSNQNIIDEIKKILN